MPEKKFLFSVAWDSKKQALKTSKYEISREEPDAVIIMSQGKEHPVKIASFYQCNNIFSDTMIGADADELTKAWDAAIKRDAVKAVRKFNKMAFEPINKKPEAAEQKPIEYKQEAPQDKEPGHEVGQQTPDATSQNICGPLTTHIEQKDADVGNSYPRAISISWGQLDSLLAFWAAKVFPNNCDLCVEARRENYYGDTEGWVISIDGLHAEDREQAEKILKQYDTQHGIDFEHEWPQGKPISGPFELSCNISNIIMGNAILPTLNPAFKYGVHRSIATDNDVLFLSDYLEIAMYQQKAKTGL